MQPSLKNLNTQPTQAPIKMRLRPAYFRPACGDCQLLQLMVPNLFAETTLMRMATQILNRNLFLVTIHQDRHLRANAFKLDQPYKRSFR